MVVEKRKGAQGQSMEPENKRTIVSEGCQQVISLKSRL